MQIHFCQCFPSRSLAHLDIPRLVGYMLYLTLLLWPTGCTSREVKTKNPKPNEIQKTFSYHMTQHTRRNRGAGFFGFLGLYTRKVFYDATSGAPVLVCLLVRSLVCLLASGPVENKIPGLDCKSGQFCLGTRPRFI